MAVTVQDLMGICRTLGWGETRALFVSTRDGESSTLSGSVRPSKVAELHVMMLGLGFVHRNGDITRPDTRRIIYSASEGNLMAFFTVKGEN